MKIIRKIHKHNSLSWLLGALILLRAMIVPGYMVSASGQDGLQIIFCDGPVSISSTQEHHHSQHMGHHDKGKSVHISPTCSDWSTSGLLLVDGFYQLPVTIFDKSFSVPDYRNPEFQQTSLHNRAIRAPPVFI